MRVTASKTCDYTFHIEPSELSQIKNTQFGNAINLSGVFVSDLGLKFSSLEQVPERMIKGELFNGLEQPRTRTISSKTDFLTDLGLCVSVNTGEIVKTENLIHNNAALSIEPDHYRFVCNHIPQIFYQSELGTIIAIDGVYNFNSRLFKGFLMFE